MTQSNRGAGPARNRGLGEARGEFVAFLDADDYWARDCLEKLHTGLVGTGVQLAYCGWQNIGLPGGRGEPFIPPDYSRVDKIEAFLGGCRWPIHAALTRRDSIERIGGFDERWTSCMDYDLWLRLVSLVDIVLVPEVLAFYRHHQGVQITKDRTTVAVNHWRIQEAFLKKNPQVVERLGRRRVRDLTLGELLRRGYVCYWDEDLIAARFIFRTVMKRGYGSLRDGKYMLPSLLPLPVHRSLLRFLRKDARSD